MTRTLCSLEAAVSRIEDVAVLQPAPGSGSGAAAGESAATSSAATKVDVPPSVEAWDQEVAPKVRAFVDLSHAVGGNVQTQVSVYVKQTHGGRSPILSSAIE